MEEEYSRSARTMEGNVSLRNCSRLSNEQLTAIFNTRVTVATISIAACLITLILICIMICYLKVWGTLIHRLKLYLTIAAVVVSILYLLQVMPMKTIVDGGDAKQEWGQWCKVIAFILQYSDWVLLLIICWMILFLLCLTQPLFFGIKSTLNPISERRKIHYEFAIVIFTLIFPLLFLWALFLNNDYGLAEGVCGSIRSSGSGCGNSTGKFKTSFYYLLGTWYIPAFIVALLCTVGVIVVAYSLWWYQKKKGYSNYISSAVIKGAPPFIYLILYNMINCVDTTSVIVNYGVDFQRGGTINYNLWMTHAVTGPCRALAVPFAFVIGQVFIQWYSKRPRQSYGRLL